MKELKKEHNKETPFHICGAKSLFAKKAEIFEIYDELLGKVYQANSALFLRLYDSAQNGGHCTGMSQTEFDKAIAKVKTSINSPFATQLTYQFLIKRIHDFAEKLDTSQHNCFTWGREQLGKLGITLKDSQLEGIISITTLYARYKPEENIPPCENCILSKEEANLPKSSRNKWEGKQMYERFVTYDVNRDRRTEAWKTMTRSITKYKIIHTASITTAMGGAFMFYGALIAGSAAMLGFTVASAPVTLPALAISSVVMTSSVLLIDKLEANVQEAVSIDKSKDLAEGEVEQFHKQRQNLEQSFSRTHTDIDPMTENKLKNKK